MTEPNEETQREEVEQFTSAFRAQRPTLSDDAIGRVKSAAKVELLVQVRRQRNRRRLRFALAACLIAALGSSVFFLLRRDEQPAAATVSIRDVVRLPYRPASVQVSTTAPIVDLESYRTLFSN